MNKSIISFLTVATLSTAANATTFTLDNFTAGDTTAVWNVSDAGLSGVITATTTINGGFSAAYDSATIVNDVHMNGSFTSQAISTGGSVTVTERGDGGIGTISFSYIGDLSLIDSLGGAVGSLDGRNSNTLTIAGSGVNATSNEVNMVHASTSVLIEAGDAVTSIAGDNTNGAFTFDGDVFGSTYTYGGAGNVRTTSQLGFGTIVTVPEPSSTLLLGLGAFGLLARRKR